MFDAKGNDGYYELGLLSAQLVRDVIIGLRDKEAVEKEEIQKAEEKRKSVNLTVKVQEDEESSEEEDEDMETPVDANVGRTSPAAVENVEISNLQAVSQSLEDDSLPTPSPSGLRLRLNENSNCSQSNQSLSLNGHCALNVKLVLPYHIVMSVVLLFACAIFYHCFNRAPRGRIFIRLHFLRFYAIEDTRIL